MDALRARLGIWLGEPRTIRNNASFKLHYRFSPEISPSTSLRVKIEINTRENFAVLDRLSKKFSVKSA